MLSQIALVTGATGGLGLATATGLASAGCRVVLTGRNAEKGRAALAHVRREAPGADIEFRLLDMADLAGIARFAASWGGPLTILVNNAGVMGYPTRRTTKDGLEAQIGINYLGHFALTLGLLPALTGAEGARVVSVASLAHRSGRIALDDLNSERSYSPTRAYAQSKLAMLMFARALQRRAEARGWTLRSIAAHPGWSRTDIVTNGFGNGLFGQVASTAFRLLGQSAAAGARPTLFAALDPAAKGGEYYGPAQLGETRGPVKPAKVMPQAQDEAVADQLWALSEQLTGVHFP